MSLDSDVKSLIRMDLHEEIRISIDTETLLYIIRVPGGWIYTQTLPTVTSVFVPLPIGNKK